MRRLLFLPGVALIGWGFYGLFTTAHHPRPLAWLTFFLGANVLTDAVVAPVVIVTGLVVARAVPRRIRPYVVSGLIISGVVLLIGLPLARGYGLRGDNPSILPLDYTRGLAITLVSVWAGVALLAGLRLTRLSRVQGEGGGPGRTGPAAKTEQ